MLEIEISYISANEDPTFASLVKEFSQQYGIKVNLRRMDWAIAWADLFTMASQGQGSDVSSIGSTWVSTLAKLDALRPFKPGEVAQMGGAEAFAAPAWEGTKLSGDQRIWSIPWSGWMYLICYRKDVLQEMGIDPSKAFSTPQSIQDTLDALQTSPLEVCWLNPDVRHPYSDLIHTAASWVWAAGGEFMDSGGSKALFDSPQAITGLTHWLNTYRSVPRKYQRLNMRSCVELFVQGRAAAALMDIHAANTTLRVKNSAVPGDKIGFSNLTNTPWSGGGNFVVWKHTEFYPERERAAVELVKFLARKESGLRWMMEQALLPVRVDALHESYPPDNPLQDVVMFASQHGRAYQNVPHWRRVETQLCLELGAALWDAREHPESDTATILRTRLEPLAQRLNIILEK